MCIIALQETLQLPLLFTVTTLNYLILDANDICHRQPRQIAGILCVTGLNGNAFICRATFSLVGGRSLPVLLNVGSIPPVVVDVKCESVGLWGAHSTLLTYDL